MKTEIKHFCCGPAALFATCALLIGTVLAQADSLVLFPNGDFDHPAGTNAPWVETFGGGTPTYSYPTTGGNPNGYGVIDMTSDTAGWAIWVGGNTTPLPLAPMGMISGNTYNFVQDMISIVDGDGIHPPGVKIESWGPSGKISDSGDMTVTITSTWQTYSFPYTIAAGATGIKVVPLWSSSGKVGYDNIGVMVPPQPLLVSITSPADSATVSTNFVLAATATVSPGTVTNVYFYDGSTLLGNSLSFPYNFAVSGAALGNHALKVVARDSNGNAATSSVVNVTVIGLAPPAPNYPTNNAPKPTAAAIDVISLYNSSSTYTNISPINWYPWGSTASSGDFPISGGQVVKSYLGLGYAGVEVNPSYNPATALDVSAMNTFHVDVWTTANQIAIKLVSTINGAAPEVVYPASGGVITSNHWVSLDIPLSVFTNLVSTLDLSHIDQLLWVDNGDIPGSGVQQGNFYIDNVYFYSNSVAIPPVPYYPTNNSATPTRPPGGVLAMYNSSGTYSNHANIGWYAAWSSVFSMGNYAITGGNTVLSYLGLQYSGVEFYNPNQIDASPYNTLHADIWTTANQIAIKLVSTDNGAAPEVIYPASSGVITSNHWVSLDIPLSAFTSLVPTLDLTNLDQLLWVDNVDIPGSGAQNGNFYIDNVYFYSNTIVQPIIATSFSSGDFNMSFPTQNGLNYSVQFKTNLTDTIWQTLSTLYGNGSSQKVADSVNQRSRFYRLYVY